LTAGAAKALLLGLYFAATGGKMQFILFFRQWRKN